MSTPWICPGCQRRVPAYATKCHCGAARPARPTPAPRRSEPLATPARQRAPLGWDIWALIGVIVLVLVFAIVSLFRPYQPPRIVPLLGYVDATPPPHPKHDRRR
ncbi:MAG: hypothetical protein MUF51_00040 [Vicinamibacteria bacterium]|jgi:hypothetical protein|nr:hypothetical protein [Vicinamibacteria bacterium]